MKERKYPYFEKGEIVRCVENKDMIDGELNVGEIYEVVHPQCTPYGISVKNASGKEIWTKNHSNFEWVHPFKEGNKLRCMKTHKNSIYNETNDEIVAGEIYEVVYPQYTPYGIMVKNVTGKQLFSTQHENFEWID